jgi:hypothetical protein
MAQEEQHKLCDRKYLCDIDNNEAKTIKLQYKYMAWISNIILLLFVGIASYTVKNMNDQILTMTKQSIERDIRITAIESSRFTDKDGLALWQEIWRIRDEISKSSIAPQKEVSDRLNEINKDIATLNIKVNELSILLKEYRNVEKNK